MKTITAISSAFFLVLCLAGCVSTANVSLSNGRLAQSAGSSLAVTSRPLPDFAALKPTNALTGAIGGLASVSSGNELIGRYSVPDPAIIIVRDLSGHLAENFKVAPQSAGTIPINSTDPKEIAAAAAGKADLVLDVQTVNWSCLYLPLNWSRYRVFYTVKLRLIDVKKQEMIAEGFFAWKTPDDSVNPTYDELVASNAKVLRQQLEEAGKAATGYFRSQILVEKN